jgi:hypothetical protein
MKTKTTIFLLLFSSTLFSCTADVLDKDADTPEEAVEHTLLREWQRVIRYDCNNKVVSDKIETVRSPTKYVSIVPDTTKDFYSSGIRNVTNNAWIGGSYQFTIDMAPSLLNLKVEEGLNRLDYKFYYCTEYLTDELGRPTSDCAKTPTIDEAGTLYIKVIYQQKWLDGFIESKPTAEECKPKP